MKKLVLGAAMLLFAQFSFGQMVSDNATIPVSVTLNAILRLTVTSGGNIQFVFNTMGQYADGIANTAGTTTTFKVASSRDFTVTMTTEDATLMGVETTETIPLNILEWVMAGTGVGGATSGAALAAAQIIVPDGEAGAAGADNTFDIQWAAGVTNSILDLATQPAADVYVTNVFLNLQPR
ncbi:MAG: hypothetical protein PHE03_09785 [Bacteroidales bacterium]|nr:hypothetical protein [Bacteroidales bacterium]